LDKAWFLSGYCRLRQGPRFFRLDRIDRLAVRDEHFTPRDLNLGDRSATAEPFTVTVHFDPTIVRWVRERQHFSWVEEQTPPTGSALGGDETVMVYRPRSFEQIEGWLLSWGDKMEVLEPLALRERLATAAARILSRHRES
jgi:predicted DNA-binding transcriptional regulator YafY